MADTTCPSWCRGEHEAGEPHDGAIGLARVGDGALITYPGRAANYGEEEARPQACTAEEARELAAALLRNAEIAENPSSPANTAATTVEHPGAEDLPWAEFLAILARHGHYRIVEDGLEYRKHEEQSSRRWLLTPSILRTELTKSGFRRQEDYPNSRFPVGCEDSLNEFLGALEEPYDHQYVIMIGIEFHSSPDGTNYRTGQFVNHGLGPSWVGPPGQWYAPPIDDDG